MEEELLEKIFSYNYKHFESLVSIMGDNEVKNLNGDSKKFTQNNDLHNTTDFYSPLEIKKNEHLNKNASNLIDSTIKETLIIDEKDEYVLKPNGLGSNNCVISGKFTKSGLPILCNDPHLLNNDPSFWYLVRMKIGDKFNIVGGICAGLPAILIGSNGITTWGITNSLVDTNDIWRVEKSGDYTYTLDGVQYALKLRTETFKYDGKEV